MKKVFFLCLLSFLVIPLPSVIMAKNPAPIAPEFTGQSLFNDSELYYFNHRYYFADLGIFLTPDPLGQYPSLYSYAAGDPLNRIDPSGLIFERLTGFISEAFRSLHSCCRTNTIDDIEEVFSQRASAESVTGGKQVSSILAIEQSISQSTAAEIRTVSGVEESSRAPSPIPVEEALNDVFQSQKMLNLYRDSLRSGNNPAVILIDSTQAVTHLPFLRESDFFLRGIDRNSTVLDVNLPSNEREIPTSSETDPELLETINRRKNYVPLYKRGIGVFDSPLFNTSGEPFSITTFLNNQNTKDLFILGAYEGCCVMSAAKGGLENDFNVFVQPEATTIRPAIVLPANWQEVSTQYPNRFNLIQ